MITKAFKLFIKLKAAFLIVLFVTIGNHFMQAQSWYQLGNDIDGESSGDISGNAVSFSDDGQIVAIAALGNGGINASIGHARVYKWDDENDLWTQMGQDIDGEAEGDEFGVSIALSGDGTTVAIGSIYNDYTGEVDDPVSYGHVRVFRWNNTSEIWEQMSTDINGENPFDRSGQAVSLSLNGNILAISTPFHDGSQSDIGIVKTYEWDDNNDTWNALGSGITGITKNERIGSSLSLSDDGLTIAIGSRYSSPNGTSSGKTQIYYWDNGSNDWAQKGVDINGEASIDVSGVSVSLSADGNHIAIGAYGNDNYATDAGHLRVFEWNDSGNSWVQKGESINGVNEDDQFGLSVSLSANGTIVAGGAFLNDGVGNKAGHTRVFSVERLL